MNLNDPFGRIKKQREKEYHALRTTLMDAGINDRHEAEKLLETLAKRGKFGLLIIIPLTLILAALLPQFQIVIIALGGLISAWLFKTTTRSRQHIRRYIEEELSHDGDSREF